MGQVKRPVNNLADAKKIVADMVRRHTNRTKREAFIYNLKYGKPGTDDPGPS